MEKYNNMNKYAVISTEIWKDIKDYEGLYQVSSLGRIRSLMKSSGGSLYARKTPLIRKLQYNAVTGYIQVGLNKWQGGGRIAKLYRVHRLVAIAFIVNQYNLKEVNHKDGNKKNNNVENLEWTSREENIRHGFDTGLISVKKGEETSGAKLTNEIVLSVFKSNVGPRELSRRMNLPYSTVASIKNGGSWNHITGLPYKRRKKNEVCNSIN